MDRKKFTKSLKKSKKCIQNYLYYGRINLPNFIPLLRNRGGGDDENVTEVVGDLALRPSLAQFWARFRPSSKLPYTKRWNDECKKHNFNRITFRLFASLTNAFGLWRGHFLFPGQTRTGRKRMAYWECVCGSSKGWSLGNCADLSTSSSVSRCRLHVRPNEGTGGGQGAGL